MYLYEGFRERCRKCLGYICFKINASLLLVLSDVILLQDNISKSSSEKKEEKLLPHTHWRKHLSVNVLEDRIDLDRQKISGEIYPYLRSVKHILVMHILLL